MTPREKILAVIRHEEVRPVPYTLAIEPDVAARLDAHYGNTAWRAQLNPYTCSVRAVETDIKEPLDDVRIRDGYGSIWRVDQRPWHLETPVLAQPSFDGYTFPSPERFYLPAEKAAGIVRAAEQRDRFVVAQLGWGLFERSWTLRGFENVLMDAIEEPDFFAEMLERLTQLYLAFLEYTCDLPADGILFGDDWGDQRGIILGAERWRKFLKPCWARIYRAVHAHGKLVMHHSCGSVAEIMPDLIEIGMDVLESCQPEAAGMNPYELKRKWGDKITFWGCLGSQSTIPHGSPAEVRAEVAKLCREMGRGGGFILAPVKPLQPETPTVNAVAVVESFLQLAG
jgi:uroporphyrinogen decarboxylase